MFSGSPQKGFYHSANAILGKVGRIASEEVVLQLLNSKCIPVLLYSLEACPLPKSDLSSVDFIIVRFLMKLFNTNMDIINNCRQYFDVKLPSTLWSDRVRTFEKKFAECHNIFLQNFSLSSIAYIYLLVMSVFLVFFPFATIMVNKDVYIKLCSG